jgi:hypothetical protein
MKPLFTGEELRVLKRLDEALERPPLSVGEVREAEARDAVIRRARGFRAGQGLATLPAGWFERARGERFSSTEEAARACRVSAKLMWYLECGSVTVPELARRIGRVLGLSRMEVKALTCARTMTRRWEEARARQGEERALQEGTRARRTEDDEAAGGGRDSGA